MKVVFFGTFNEGWHPRVRVLREGLDAHGWDVTIVNVPSSITTKQRLEIAQRPWRAITVLSGVVKAYLQLVKEARDVGHADAVVVGYLGVLDVHLARRLFRAPIVLDHMAPIAGTFQDRRITGLRLRIAATVDRWAENAAALVLVDTPEHLAQIDRTRRDRAMVVAVGAPNQWFTAQRSAISSSRPDSLSIVFFGLYTPLQGIPRLARALDRTADLPVRWTLVGDGQDRHLVQHAIDTQANVTSYDWVAPHDLPALVAAHDVCLGIFGTTPKAERVVPNKVYQGAAAGCLVITSDTACQRTALAKAGVFVDSDDPDGLANAVADMLNDRTDLQTLRKTSARWAVEHFSPEAASLELSDRMKSLAGRNTGRRKWLKSKR